MRCGFPTRHVVFTDHTYVRRRRDTAADIDMHAVGFQTATQWQTPFLKALLDFILASCAVLLTLLFNPSLSPGTFCLGHVHGKFESWRVA